MTQDSLDPLFKNYTELLARVDSHTQRVAQALENEMACKKGCDSCCRFLNLFPVEALSLSRAFFNLSPKDQTRVENRINRLEKEELSSDCPLLIDRACILYFHRPVICRTHGLPIYIEKEGETLVDFCPKNFKGMDSFPKETLISLEQLNTLLTAVNAHFLTLVEADLPDRIPVSQALFLCKDL